MNKQKRKVILEIGAEGGSLTLLETETPEGRHFEVAIVDQTLEWIEEGGVIDRVVGTSETWQGALEVLDTYPWHMLYPLHVLPEFAGRILEAAEARLAKEQSVHAGSRLIRWREKCRQPQEK